METIETIFENYKAAHNEETPVTAGQQAGLQELVYILEEVAQADREEYRKQQIFFDKAAVYARESEKSGFITGFKMAVSIMRESAL